MEIERLKTGLVSLKIVARSFEVELDPDHLIHSLGLSSETDCAIELKRAAKALDLRIQDVKLTWDRLSKISLPAIAKLDNGFYIVILNASTEEILFFDPTRPQSSMRCGKVEFETVWSGSTVLVKNAKNKFRNNHFSYKWFVAEFLKHRAILVEIILAALIVQVFGIAAPIFSQIVIDKVVVHSNASILNTLGVGMLILIGFEISLSTLQSYMMTHTAGRVDAVLGNKILLHVLKLPLRYFELRQVGVISTHIKEVENIRLFITGASLGTILDLFSVIIVVPLMFSLSTKLSIISISSLPLFLICSMAATPLMRTLINKKFEINAKNQSFLVETISGIQTIKSLAIEASVGRRWGNMLADYIASSYRTSMTSSIFSSLGQFLQKTSTLGILWIGAREVIEGNLSVGNLIAFQMLSARLIQPVIRISQIWQELQQVSLSIKKIGDIMNHPVESQYRSSSSLTNRVRGTVEFAEVGFRYNERSKDALSQISFTANAGDVIGIVGRSGSGKSSLTKLLQCMYLPYSGRILIDGLDARAFEPSYLRNQIGAVLQENFLFEGTIKSNISISSPFATIDSIISTSKIAGAHDFIMELPEGYDTKVGERGINLSGGQRQRIAIARALLKNPQILIFDEATSALDYESEKIIQTNMSEICKGRTVFIIAHRLSTVMHADTILVLDEGKIVERGTHASLIERRGLYYYLSSQQDIA